MQCPVCGKPVRPADRECEACGEVQTAWRNIEFYGRGLRQRGLSLAERGDHLGACLAFLEAALTNPLDSLSLVDTARALVHLSRPQDALRLLAGVKSPEAVPAANALRAEIERQQENAAAVDEVVLATLAEETPGAETESSSTEN